MHTESRCAVLYALHLAVLALTASAEAVDNPEELQSIVLAGEAEGDNFGKSIVNLGDVNGNGFDDIGVGAVFADFGANATGAVYVYFGEKGFRFDLPDLILTGQNANDQAGISVAGNMDLNGDGFADIAVGVRFSDVGGVDHGAVFIYYGGPTLSNTPNLILTGEARDDWFGQSVSAAGDVNADGFDDLIVGAPYNDAAANAAGRAYILFGGAPMNAVPDVILHGARTANSHFGWSVSGAGDVNADGYADVIVGERLFGTGMNGAIGRAYVFLGGANVSTTPHVVLQGELRNDWFGESVAGLGDFNGDGYDDVAVGAIYNDANGSASGRAYVFFGGAPMNNVPDATLNGPHMDAQLGNAVGRAGDVDGDGRADLIAGAHFANSPAGSAAGAAYVVYGGALGAASPDITIGGNAANDQLGESVGGGVATSTTNAILAGAHFSDITALNAGAAIVARLASACPGDANGDRVVNFTDLNIVLSFFGQTVAPGTSGDLNNDGAVNFTDLNIVLSFFGTSC